MNQLLLEPAIKEIAMVAMWGERGEEREGGGEEGKGRAEGGEGRGGRGREGKGEGGEGGGGAKEGKRKGMEGRREGEKKRSGAEERGVEGRERKKSKWRPVENQGVGEKSRSLDLDTQTSQLLLSSAQSEHRQGIHQAPTTHPLSITSLTYLLYAAVAVWSPKYSHSVNPSLTFAHEPSPPHFP